MKRILISITLALLFDQTALAEEVPSSTIKISLPQPEDPKDFDCVSDQTVLLGNKELKKDGLGKKLKPLTGKCVGDIETVWAACVKSKGTKRKKWCEVLTGYCSEYDRQANIVNDKKLARYDQEKKKREAEKKKKREEEAQQVRNQFASMGQYGDVFSGMVNSIQSSITNQVDFDFNPPKKLGRYIPWCSSGWPEQEEARKKREAQELKALRAAQSAGNMDFQMVPQMVPSMPSISQSSDVPTTRDTSYCIQNSQVCSSSCNPISYGFDNGPSIDNIQRCREECDRSYHQCLGR